MTEIIAKVTAKNQLTLPKAALEAVGWPTHFKVVPVPDGLVLMPATLTTRQEAARTLGALGFTPEVLREARRIVARRKADGG